MRAETGATVGTIRRGAWARRRTVAAVAMGWLLSGSLSAAQSVPVVTPLLNQTAFQPGATLQFGAAVTNPGGGPAVDFYVGIQLPDGVTAVTLRLGASPVTGSLANLAALMPTAPNVSLTSPFAVNEPALFSYTFTGVEPVGTYTTFVGAVVAGGLRDGALGPGELLAFTTRTFTFGAGGILLPGPTDTPAVEATSDYQASAGVDDTQISVETGGRRFARTQLEVVFRADATVGQVNAALTSVNGRIVSMLDGVLILLVEFPDPGSMAGLNAIRTRLAAMTGVREVVLQGFDDVDALPSNIGPASSNLAKIDHLLAARAHAAWNTVAALTAPSASRPVIVVGDKFGGGAPGTPFDVADTPGDFGTGRLDGHGYHVLGIIGASFGGTTSDTGLATGLLPGRSSVRIVDMRRRNVTTGDLGNRLVAMVKASGNRVVVNTSLGHDCETPEQAADICNSAEAPREARRWLEKVRGTEHVTEAGAGVESRFVHATSAGNADASGLDSTLSSMWTSAAQWPDLRDLDNRAVPNATNLLVVENHHNGIGDPTMRGCLSDFSKRALTRTALTMRSNVSAVGERVWSLTNASTTAGDKDGTSMAAPQVAALAAWIWTLRPSYTNLEVLDRIVAMAEAVPGCGAADAPAPAIDVYASVLATDVNALDAPVRQALLDVGTAGGVATPDGVFDEADLQLFAQAFQAAGGARDYSRHDLNGDGVTGVGGRQMPFDLDYDRQYLTTTYEAGGSIISLDERQLSDVDVLCFYAYSPLYTGSRTVRTATVGTACRETPGSPRFTRGTRQMTVGVSAFANGVSDSASTTRANDAVRDVTASGGGATASATNVVNQIATLVNTQTQISMTGTLAATLTASGTGASAAADLRHQYDIEVPAGSTGSAAFTVTFTGGTGSIDVLGPNVNERLRQSAGGSFSVSLLPGRYTFFAGFAPAASNTTRAAQLTFALSATVTP